MSGPWRTIHYGIGQIGSRIVELVARKRALAIVGAIDTGAEKAGRDVGDVAGLGHPLGVLIASDPATYLRPGGADIVLHSTSSDLEGVVPQLAPAIEAGLNVISTCEELAYPWWRHPELAQRIDGLAKQHGVTVLGTGVNPGFLMDTLVLAVTAACQEIESIRVTRVMDAACRRSQFQRKIGAGLRLREFEERAGRGELGHVGMLESLAMLADSLGWRLDGIEEAIEPVIAEGPVGSEFIQVEPGEVTGIRQVARGVLGGARVIVLELVAFLGATQPRDAIVIEGIPKVDLEIKGGLPGDPATTAIVVNSIPFVMEARPGLLTTRDLPLTYAAVR